MEQGSVKFLDIGPIRSMQREPNTSPKLLPVGTARWRSSSCAQTGLRTGRDRGAAAIKKNTSLTNSTCHSRGLADAGLVALANALVGNVTLKTLLLGGNKFGPGAKKAWQGVLGWPVAEGAAKGSSLDVNTLDFIPLMAPLWLRTRVGFV